MSLTNLEDILSKYEDFLTVQEVSNILRVSEITILRYLHRPKNPLKYVTLSTKVRILKPDLISFLEQNGKLKDEV